jgi:hypothetical protein
MIVIPKFLLRGALMVGFVLSALAPISAVAQEMEEPERRMPLYIVNGKRVSFSEAKEISPRDIVSEKMLPADEQTIAKYGAEASNGVVVITLRYDTPARFEIGGQEQRYSAYVAQQVKWGEFDPVARVIVAFKVGADGSVSLREVLESSDKRLQRRVEKVLASSPRWIPAKREGKGVDTDHVLRITLPEGRELPPEPVILIR